MSKPIALLFDSAELVPVAVVTIAASPDILHGLAQILRAQVPLLGLVVVLVSVEVALLAFSLAVALLVEHVQQHVINAPGQIILHATARHKQ